MSAVDDMLQFCRIQPDTEIDLPSVLPIPKRNPNSFYQSPNETRHFSDYNVHTYVLFILVHRCFTMLELICDDALRTFYIILAFEERCIDTGVKYISCYLKPFLGGAATKVSKKIKSVFSQPNRTLFPKLVLS